MTTYPGDVPTSPAYEIDAFKYEPARPRYPNGGATTYVNLGEDDNDDALASDKHD